MPGSQRAALLAWHAVPQSEHFVAWRVGLGNAAPVPTYVLLRCAAPLRHEAFESEEQVLTDEEQARTGEEQARTDEEQARTCEELPRARVHHRLLRLDDRQRLALDKSRRRTKDLLK
jgi:hypothetical protein